MSEYLEFFIKTNEDKFIPLNTFCRGNAVVEFARPYVSAYSVVEPFTLSDAQYIIHSITEELNKAPASRERLNQRLELVASMKNSVDEKLDAIIEIQEKFKEIDELTAELTEAREFYHFLETMLENAMDYNNEYDDRAELKVDAKHFIYAGIECSLRDNENDAE